MLLHGYRKLLPSSLTYQQHSMHKCCCCFMSSSSYILDGNFHFPPEEAFENRAASIARRDRRNAILDSYSVRGGSNERLIKLHQSRGKLLPRDRVKTLLDSNSAFLEFSTLAAHDMYGGDIFAGGIITGIGTVSGTECVIVCNDATVKGGTYHPMTHKKHIRATEVAMHNHLPCIYLVDSGGGNLAYQSSAFADRDHFGRIFYNQAIMSSRGIPQLSLVLGSCTAGGAYIPAMCDTSLISLGSSIFLAGPPLVKAATGEVCSAEELGGADVHTRISGVADQYAATEMEAIQEGREMVADLNRSRPIQPLNMQVPVEPLFSIDNFDELIPATDSDVILRFPMRAVLARILDGSRLREFKARYGPTLITGMAHLNGCPGWAHFIQICEQRGLPLLFFTNTSDDNGMGAPCDNITDIALAKHLGKMIAGVACSKVPKITVIVGANQGFGSYAMCPRAASPRFLFVWPTARTSITSTAMASLANDEEGAAAISEQSDAFYTTSHVLDDGLILPEETREILKLALSASLNRPILRNQSTSNSDDTCSLSESSFGVFRL